MYQLDSDGIIGALAYLSAMKDKFQISISDVYAFNKKFIEGCNQVAKSEKCDCQIGRDTIVKFCLDHSDILTFDQLSNSFFISRNMNDVVLGLYGCTMYIAGIGAKGVFNDTYNAMFPKEVK